MTHEEYNAELQDMQRFVLAVGMQDRLDVERSRSSNGRFEDLIWSVSYRVFWDDRWVLLGQEIRPMTDRARYEWWDIKATKLKAQAVDLLV